jgi:hypothetical protein
MEEWKMENWKNLEIGNRKFWRGALNEIPLIEACNTVTQ